MPVKGEKETKENTKVPEKVKGTTTPTRITRSTPRRTKESANEKGHLITLTHAAISAKETHTTKGESKGQGPYYYGIGEAECSVHAVTYDDSDYSWDTTGSDARWHPRTETHEDWNCYTGWNYGYQQEEAWYDGYTLQVQGGATQPWTQNTSGTPVTSTVNDLRSSLPSGSTSA